MGFIIFLAAIIAFYVYAGKKWKDETKRRFKIIVCGISLLCTVFLLLICISGAKDLYETEKDRSLSARMDSVEYELRRGDYIGAITSMQVNHDYEEELHEKEIFNIAGFMCIFTGGLRYGQMKLHAGEISL